jgi:hypothetical protein
MRILSSALILAALGAAIAPATAQGVYIEGPGVTVGVGRPDYDRGRDWDRHRRYDERYSNRERGCRTVTVERDDGSVRQTRRCD